MSDIAICSVTFSDHRYREQQERLVQSLLNTNPDVEQFVWTEELPPGARTHEESLYGFKVHAIKFAREQGYQKIIWLDTAMICQGDLEYYFERHEDNPGQDLPPVVAVRDDSKLENTISDKAVEYFGNPELLGLHLVGGSLYCLDFNERVTNDIFDLWASAEANGIFGSVEEAVSGQINKHRHDESCLAIIMAMCGVKPVGPARTKYCQEENSVFIKKHFK